MRSTSMYDLSLDQCADLIVASGDIVTYILQGHMGNGKSALINVLDKRLPGHTPIYFDCTTKTDAGDLSLPKFKDADGSDYFRHATTEELGLHLQDTPIILMLDEIGKNRNLINPLLRLMYERKYGAYTLHPDSIVFATTNLGGEGLGDFMPAHAHNRSTLITVRKSTHLEWLEWGISNGIDHSLLGWVRDNPQLFQSYEEVKDPESNPYIFHPRDTSRKAFVTGRSLEKASHIIKRLRGKSDDTMLTAALIGTIGTRAAMDLMAFVHMANDLPSHDSIRKDPENAKIPTSASATCMVVYRALATMDMSWADNWMIYLNRLDNEAQGLFANGVRAPKYHMQAQMMKLKSFTQWVMSKAYLFGSDQ